jgi:hypothetical protein
MSHCTPHIQNHLSQRSRRAHARNRSRNRLISEYNSDVLSTLIKSTFDVGITCNLRFFFDYDYEHRNPVRNLQDCIQIVSRISEHEHDVYMRSAVSNPCFDSYRLRIFKGSYTCETI